MSRPPARFKSERKSGGCGDSWNSGVAVRGTLPGTDGFGSDHPFARTLPAVVSDLKSGRDYLGWDGEYESERNSQLRGIVEDLADDVDELEGTGELPPRKAKSIRWLLSGALKQIEAAETIRDKWRLRPNGTYSLSYGDTMRDFPAALHWQDCENPGNILSPPGPHYGFEVEGRGRGPAVTCPTRTELQQRPVDRSSIVALYRDAARWLRCAEWSMWRVVYYRRALAAWLQTPEGQSTRTTPEPPPQREPGGPPEREPDGGTRTTPDGPSRTTPGATILQILYIPEFPPEVPDVVDAPPPDPLDPGLGEAPTTEPGSASSAVKVAVVVGVFAAGWWAFNKML